LKILEELLPGVLLIELNQINDERGYFLKNFNFDDLKNFGINFIVKESFFTYSKENVLRGMHFQLPPKEHNKTVQCINGSITDVLLDLRPNNFGMTNSIKLSENDNLLIYIPKGVAHGFCTNKNHAKLFYQVDEGYDENYDCGILWDSFGYSWPLKNPILSIRDSKHVTLDKFNSSVFK